MNKTGIAIALLMATVLVGLALPASGENEPETTTPAVADASDNALGLNLDIGYASAYVFRGWNVFQTDSQLDQNMLLAPGITWVIPGTDFSLGYWGAYQISGDGIGDHIDGALGAEQDIIFGYTFKLPDNMSLSPGLVAYVYPLADKDVAGDNWPLYLEPGATFAWSGMIDASLKAAYFLGIQNEPGIRGISYLYVNPRIGRAFALSERMKLSTGLGYGYKLRKEGNDGVSNIHDIALDATLPFDIGGGFYVAPGIHTGWTNVIDKGFSDELFVYGSLNVGMNI